jgi:hypothetical protein
MILYILAAIGALFLAFIALMVIFYLVSSWILRGEGGCWRCESGWTREYWKKMRGGK